MRTTYIGKDNQEYLTPEDAATYWGGLYAEKNESGVEYRTRKLTADEKARVEGKLEATRAKRFELYGSFDVPEDTEEVSPAEPTINTEELEALRAKAAAFDALQSAEKSTPPTVTLADGTEIPADLSTISETDTLVERRKGGRPKKVA